MGHVSRLRIGSVLIANVGGVVFQIHPPVWPTVTFDENIFTVAVSVLFIGFNGTKILYELCPEYTQ
jgi:hypothetical protein